MNIADFFIGYSVGICSLILLVFMMAALAYKKRQSLMPKMSKYMMGAMVKRANNASRQAARTRS